LVAVVLLAPLPLGSVYPLSWALMAAIVGVLLLAHGLIILVGSASITHTPSAMWSWLVPFLLVAAWAAVQGTSLTPLSWHHPLWAEAAAALDTNIAGSISLDPFETVSALLRLLAYGGIFWLALHLCRAPQRAEAVFIGLSVAGLLYAAYGLAVKFTGSNTVLWYSNPYYRGVLTSTFVNRNNYATYAGLGLICTTGLIIKLYSEAMSLPSRGRVRVLALIEAVTGRSWALLPSWILTITALLLTASRGGVLSSFIGLIALVGVVRFAKILRRRHAVVMGTAIVVCGAAFLLFSGEKLAERLAYPITSPEERSSVYALTLKAITERPWLGTGYGTFEGTFYLYRDETVHHGHYDKAHDTYLENALELGVPAEVLLTLSLGSLLLRCLVGALKRHHDAVYPCIGIGATVLVASHSVVDFPLQIPAIAATYALIMGAAAAQSWRPFELSGRSSGSLPLVDTH
jgi:O-antigen ligase